MLSLSLPPPQPHVQRPGGSLAAARQLLLPPPALSTAAVTLKFQPASLGNPSQRGPDSARALTAAPGAAAYCVPEGPGSARASSGCGGLSQTSQELALLLCSDTLLSLSYAPYPYPNSDAGPDAPTSPPHSDPALPGRLRIPDSLRLGLRQAAFAPGVAFAVPDHVVASAWTPSHMTIMPAHPELGTSHSVSQSFLPRTSVRCPLPSTPSSSSPGLSFTMDEESESQTGPPSLGTTSLPNSPQDFHCHGFVSVSPSEPSEPLQLHNTYRTLDTL